MSILAAAVPADYEAPGVSDFWQPLIGSGSTAITRACFVAVISVALIAWFIASLGILIPVAVLAGFGWVGYRKVAKRRK